MANVVINIFLIMCFNVILQGGSQELKKDMYLPVPKLITEAGYPAETHRVTTPDGYALQMHRIPAGRRTARRTASGGKGKKAVFVMHGLSGSSGDFVIMGPERSLAYLLADAGYDVWLGNLRGNIYTTHQSLTRRDPAFWEYSFHEHGMYDVPSMIDKVLNVTGLQKVLYVGYSMGTTSFFTMMSEKPEYNDKIVSFVALAPAVYLKNMKPLAWLLLRTFNVPRIMRRTGQISATIPTDFMEFIFGNICGDKDPKVDICMNLVYALVGEDIEQYDSRSHVGMSRMQPMSWRQLEHFGKIALTGVFTSWGGGLENPVKPYNISNVGVPVSLLYGENDQLTIKSETMKLADELHRTGMLEAVRPACSWPKFNHFDFVFAKDVGELLNKPLIKHIGHLYNKYGSV